MAYGIRQDQAAVKAALPTEWSDGQVGAQVNYSKRKPRIVFGRANFELLCLLALRRS
jgi:transposase